MLQSFATKQAQKSPYSAMAIGALMIGGERVRLTKIFWHIIISINDSLYSTLSLILEIIVFWHIVTTARIKVQYCNLNCNSYRSN